MQLRKTTFPAVRHGVSVTLAPRFFFYVSGGLDDVRHAAAPHRSGLYYRAERFMSTDVMLLRTDLTDIYTHTHTHTHTLQVSLTPPLRSPVSTC